MVSGKPREAALAYIGLGANLGGPARQVREALDQLGTLPGTRLLSRSSLYRTEPIGFIDQPPFINAVARVETTLSPQALLAGLLDLEQRHGRVRGRANGPRVLDLDLLMYDDRVLASPELILPHPRMHLRAFVLLPLVEIAPLCVIPRRGPARMLLGACAGQGVERLEGVFAA
ncbi:MAG: 2-amino-4-hydroxy-6-hydroxymethyldihydropteridine diphosphokinase [Betaproteobacteria bacterium]|nr:2-amino-4-hydroxy-6-hydroxymethyldihydropteridine diphosphokinase [Betaproteobacteria bacterium]